ncbi:unnamed protein product [Phytophthora fragariaefolia]|uniref:Unnamed protein product n=1 Tax=Phytophthora fragariaefolia TaxID=1490495 RepID=A0A9W7CRX2_9STRA|nr:unnamed protein product [Phytophthora fragariaefolia]
MSMIRKGTRSSAKAPAKKTTRAPKPKAKPRDQAPALVEAIEAASAAIQSPGASNAPSSTHSRRSRSPYVTGYEVQSLAYTVVAGGSFNNKTKYRVWGKINSVYFWDGGGGHPSSCEALKYLIVWCSATPILWSLCIRVPITG